MLKPGAFSGGLLGWRGNLSRADSSPAGQDGAAARSHGGPSAFLFAAGLAPLAAWLVLLPGFADSAVLPGETARVGLDAAVAFALAAAAFTVGGLPARPATRPLAGVSLALVLHGVVALLVDRFAAPDSSAAVVPLLALGLGGAFAVAGLARRGVRSADGAWAALALALLAAAGVPEWLRPATAHPVVGVADCVRLILGIGAVFAGVLDLRRVTAELAARLVAEEGRAARSGGLLELRSDLARTLAHEMGSPIAAIRGFSDMLALPVLPAADRERALAGIRTEAELLHRLVADMRADAGLMLDAFVIRRRPVALAPLLSDAAAFARTLPGAHAVREDMVGAPCVVEADPERIGQVLRNLLANAAKYSPVGAPITLRARRRGDRIRVEVVDRGYGIAREDQARIFEKFERGREGAGRADGLGLGLYVSREIVRGHGADLRVRSAAGVGSTFSFELEVVA